MIENIFTQIFLTPVCFITYKRKIEEGVREVVNGLIKADATIQVENIRRKVVKVMGEMITKPQLLEAWRQMVNWLIEISKNQKICEGGGEVVHWLVKFWR